LIIKTNFSEKYFDAFALQIKQFVGSDGVRDFWLLESTIQRPFATFGKEKLYPTAADKAAVIVESIVKNHPFLDGNKRTGYILMRLFLLKSKMNIEATESEKYEFIINIAEGK
jgi:death-on-curing protein